MQFIIKFIFEWNTIAQFFLIPLWKGCKHSLIWNNFGKYFMSEIFTATRHTLAKYFTDALVHICPQVQLKSVTHPQGFMGGVHQPGRWNSLTCQMPYKQSVFFLVYYFSFFLLLQSTSIIFVDWKNINIINFTCQGDILMNFVALFLGLFYELSVVLHIFRLFCQCCNYFYYLFFFLSGPPWKITLMRGASWLNILFVILFIYWLSFCTWMLR